MRIIKKSILLLFISISLFLLSSITYAQELRAFVGQLAYIDAHHNLWILQGESGDRIQLTFDASETIRYTYPQYSPDGTMLAYCQKDTSEQITYKLQIVRVGEWQPITLSEDILCKDWPNRSYDWSPDSTKIIYNRTYSISKESNSGFETVEGIWMIDVTTGDSSEIIPTLGEAPLLNPQWAPSGEWIKFYELAYFTGLGSMMTGQNDSGTIFSWLGAGNLWPGYSDWSPDGSQLVFDEVPYTGFPGAGLYIASPNGENIHSIFTDTGYVVTKPIWSPDGNTIAFQQKSYPGGKGNLALISPDGGNLRQAFSSDNYLMPVTWSPEGDQLLFAVRTDNLFELFIHDLQSSNNYSIGLSTNAGADWSNAVLDSGIAQETITIPEFPYSESLMVYVSPDHRLVLYDPDDGSEIDLTESLAVSSFYPSPSGRHYVYGRHIATTPPVP